MIKLEHTLRLLGITSLILIASSLYATTRASSDQVFEVDNGSGRFFCGLAGSKWVPGSLTKGGDFISLAQQIASLRAQIKKASGAKRAKLIKKSNSLRSLRQIRASACAGGPPNGSATPTPESIVTGRPTATATARATQSPTPGNSCFDANGNTSCFGIPNGTRGNKNSGSIIVTSDCNGCHNERQNRTYQQITNSFSGVKEMSRFVDLPLQDVADIVAYLNRFNTQ